MSGPVNSMRNNTNTRRGDCQQFFHLTGSELGDGNNHVTALGSFARLFGESRAKIWRRIVPGQDEQIVKRSYGAMGANVNALIQRMEDIARRGTDEQTAHGIWRNPFAEGTNEAMRTVAVEKFLLRVCSGQTGKDLARVDTNTR